MNLILEIGDNKMPRSRLVEPSEERKKSPEYPYWSNEFYWEFKGLQVYYKESKRSKIEDMADSYRVFMILCNNNSDKSRMEVLDMLKNATEENPVEIQGEVFWTEKN